MENRTVQQRAGQSGSRNRKQLRLLTPMQMKEYLDKYVVGQDEAKKSLCVAVYNHYKRIARRNLCETPGPGTGKSNVILLGETGSGKTLLVKTLARLLDVPCHIQDCTKITEDGYVGSDTTDCIVGLLRASDYDIPASECGIVMLDEVDKIAKKVGGPSIVRDVSGEGVQQSLLKIVEGDVVGLPPMGGRKHPEQPLLYVDTRDILFIASGAFVGLDDIIAKRCGCGQGRIGFGSKVSESRKDGAGSILSQVTPGDLRDFGMIPEFIGRFPVICNVEALGKEDLVRILTEPEDSLVRQYKELLAYDGVRLEFSDEALDYIAGLAVEMKTGARGLRNIIETVMRDIMFEAPSMRKPRGGEKIVTVTREMISQKLSRSSSLTYAGMPHL